MAQQTAYLAGMKECREALQELSRGVQTGVGKRALLKTAHFLAGQIRARAPVSRRPSDPTPGSLRDSVKVVAAKTVKKQPRVAILIDDVAAVPNEFGTHKMHAQPFARPAVNANRAAAAEVMAAGIKAETDVAVMRAARRAAKAKSR